MSEDASTLGAIGRVLGASAVSRALAVLKGLVVARLLEPQEYGVSTALAVILAYAQYADLGATAAANRDLTRAVGCGDAPAAARFAGWMGGLKLASVLVVSLGALVTASLPGIDPFLRLALVLLPGIALSSGLLHLGLLRWQAHGRITNLSRGTAFLAVADLALGVGLTVHFGLPGLLVASGLAPALVCLWAHHEGGLVRPFLPPGRETRRYVGIGVPLVALALVDHNLIYLDHVVVLSFLGLHHLGIYNIGLIAAEMLRMVGVASGVVLGPRVMRRYAAAGGCVGALRRETLLPVQLLACVLPFAIVPLWFGGDWLIQRFYSPYSASVWPMKVLLLAFYFLVVNGGVTTFLFTIDKQRRNLLIAGPALVFNVVLDVLLLRQGLGILGVALGSLVTYIAYAFVHLSYVASHFQLTRREWIRFFAGAFLPGGCLAIILAGIDWMAPPGGSFVRAALCSLLSWLLVAPLAARALRLARRIDAASEDVGALAVRR